MFLSPFLLSDQSSSDGRVGVVDHIIYLYIDIYCLKGSGWVDRTSATATIHSSFTVTTHAQGQGRRMGFDHSFRFVSFHPMSNNI